MPPKGKAVIAIVAKNQFSVLASDSDSDSETAVEPTPLVDVAPLAEVKGEVNVKDGSFRKWIIEEDTRFKSDTTNIFSSPFYKGMRSKQWGRQRPREDNDGWISIRWNQPQFQDNLSEEERSGVIYEPREETEIFVKGKKIVVLKDSITSQETLTAMAWAEKIKKSLETSESSRLSKTSEYKEALGKLSFFRKGFD